MSFQDYRAESRNKLFGHDSSQGNLTIEQINCGCMLRLADAAERISRNLESIARRDRVHDYWRARAEAERLKAKVLRKKLRDLYAK